MVRVTDLGDKRGDQTQAPRERWRLWAIDSHDLALRAHRDVLTGAKRLARGAAALVVEGDARFHSPVQASVTALVLYARTGGEDTSPTVVESITTLAVVDLCSMTKLLSARDPVDDLDLVLIACFARRRLKFDPPEAVPEGWLAALGGVASSRVRQLVVSGAIVRAPKGEGIDGESARNWLESRGVPGFVREVT